MVFNQSLFDSTEEIVVEASIDEADDDFGCPIPIDIDGNKAATRQIILDRPGIETYRGIGGGLK